MAEAIAGVMPSLCPIPGRLRSLSHPGNYSTVWKEPYLETCCRAALHRLMLAADDGRPPDLKDGPCLARLAGMGLAVQRPDARYTFTEAGRDRHTSEILHKNTAA